MSGGHWNYSGHQAVEHIRTVTEEPEIQERFPILAQFLRKLGDWLHQLDKALDYDLSGDSHIRNEAEFELQTIGALLVQAPAALSDRPELFPRGKWGTVQAWQQRTGCEALGEQAKKQGRLQ